MIATAFRIPNEEGIYFRNSLWVAFAIAFLGICSLVLCKLVKFPKDSVTEILGFFGVLFLAGSLLPLWVARIYRKMATTKWRLIEQMQAGKYLARWSISSNLWKKTCEERKSIDLARFRQKTGEFGKIWILAIVVFPLYYWYREGFDASKLTVETLLPIMLGMALFGAGMLGLGRWLHWRKHSRMFERSDSPPPTIIAKDGWFHEGILLCYGSMKDLFTEVEFVAEPDPCLELTFEANGMRNTLRVHVPSSECTNAEEVARQLRDDFLKHGAKIQSRNR